MERNDGADSRGSWWSWKGGRSCGSNPFMEAPHGVLEALVGSVSVLDAQDQLKKAMLIHALWRRRGNLTQTAHLLQVRRQAVQQMVSRYELGALVESLRESQAVEPVPESSRA